MEKILIKKHIYLYFKMYFEIMMLYNNIKYLSACSQNRPYVACLLTRFGTKCCKTKKRTNIK